jgi:integrase
MEVTVKFYKNGTKSYARHRIPIHKVSFPDRTAKGKAIRREAFFHTLREANAFAAEKNRALESAGKDNATLSRDEIAAIARFRAWRTESGSTESLASVIDCHIRDASHHRPRLTVNDAFRLRMESVERDRLSDRHREDLRSRLRRFAADFGERDISSITGDDISKWIHGLGLGPVSFRNFRKTVGSLFSLAVARGSITRNPIDAVTLPRHRSRPPAILTPQQVRALMLAAPRDILPHLVLQAFCGVRRAEVVRLRWEWIKLDEEEPYVDVMAPEGKVDSRRAAPIPPNALAWLKMLRGHPQESLEMTDTVYRRRLGQARKEIGLSMWDKNSLRHCFGSYRLSLLRNMGQVSYEMGNSIPVLKKNYANTVSRADAEAFFSILPEDGAAPENVVRFGKTA